MNYLDRVAREAKREAILKVLASSKSRTEAARKLGIKRQSLYPACQRVGIQLEKRSGGNWYGL